MCPHTMTRTHETTVNDMKRTQTIKNTTVSTYDATDTQCHGQRYALDMDNFKKICVHIQHHQNRGMQRTQAYNQNVCVHIQSHHNDGVQRTPKP